MPFLVLTLNLGPKRELELEQKVEQLKTMGFEEVIS